MTSSSFSLNLRAAELFEAGCTAAESPGIAVTADRHCVIADYGISVQGGLEAGLRLARICLSGLADVSIQHGGMPLGLPAVTVRSDDPVRACLWSQYAGWKVTGDSFFAMGSGPMRVSAGKEELLKELGATDDANVVVGVLECGALPPAAVVEALRAATGAEKILLAVAPTASIAGHVQVTARSLETALHKLHSVGFPLHSIVSGTGCAPLPPIAANDLHGIGRTNDAVLYGGVVDLWVRCDDEQIEQMGPLVPSGASPAHGEPFLSLFEAAGHDFYKLDPALFSPAVVRFHNLQSGRFFCYGKLVESVLRQSFGISG